VLSAPLRARRPRCDARAVDTRSFLALLAGGFVLLALGGGVAGNRDARRSGFEPFALALKGAGLALLTYAIYRLVKANA